MIKYVACLYKEKIGADIVKEMKTRKPKRKKIGFVDFKQ